MTERQLRPACYDDMVTGTELYIIDSGLARPVVVTWSKHCPSNMCGESYLVGWSRCVTHSSRCHVYVKKYKNASEYRYWTQSEPKLYVKE